MRIIQLCVVVLYAVPMLAMNPQLVNMKEEIQKMPILALQSEKNYLEWSLERNNVEETKRDQKLRLGLIEEELAERRKRKIESKDYSEKFEQSKME